MADAPGSSEACAEILRLHARTRESGRPAPRVGSSVDALLLEEGRAVDEETATGGTLRATPGTAWANVKAGEHISGHRGGRNPVSGLRPSAFNRKSTFEEFGFILIHLHEFYEN